MKTLVDIVGKGFLSFKSEDGKFHKAVSKDMEKLQKQINEIVFEYSYIPINKRLGLLLVNHLIRLGKETRTIKGDREHITKAQQFLKGLINSLSAYNEAYKIEVNDTLAAQKLLNYRVYKYKEKKGDGFTEEEMIKLMKVNKVIYHCFIKSGDFILHSKDFLHMQNELIEKMVKPYKME